LEEVGEFNLYEGGKLISFEDSHKFQIYIEVTLRKKINTYMNIRWSRTPYGI